MKRYQHLVNSACLGCGEWLCVTAGAYTGEIVCQKCGVVNVFSDSLRPTGILPRHGIPESPGPEIVSSE
jgi:hypothetical protein